DFPKARKPAYKLRIDFGELGVKTSSAQITKYYDKADLVGKLVLAVVNFPPRQIATFFSEVLTLGVVLGDGDIVLVHPEREVPWGAESPSERRGRPGQRVRLPRTGSRRTPRESSGSRPRSSRL